MCSGKNFSRREWGFSWIWGTFTESMNLAQGSCNDSMDFCTIILNLGYEVSTVILYWQCEVSTLILYRQYEVSTVILYWQNEVSKRYVYCQYDVGGRIVFWQYEVSTTRIAGSFCYLLWRLIIFNSLQNIIKMLKSWSLRWAGRVAHMEGASNIWNIFAWICGGDRLGILVEIDNIKIDRRKSGG